MQESILKPVEFYELALEESPKSHVTLSNLGHTCMLMRNYQKAEECLRKVSRNKLSISWHYID